MRKLGSNPPVASGDVVDLGDVFVIHFSLSESDPEIVKFLRKCGIPTKQATAALAYMEENEADATAAAVYFLKKYGTWATGGMSRDTASPYIIPPWVPSNVAEKVKAALP
ncbi:hypothetical protein ACFLYI_02935 [Chloroflexota bacterium]